MLQIAPTSSSSNLPLIAKLWWRKILQLHPTADVQQQAVLRLM